MKNFIYFLTLLLGLAVFAVGCGGSVGSGDSGKYLSGVAATGAAAADTIITLTDSNGETRTTTSGSDGSYRIEVTNLTAPYVIWFESDNKSIFATDCGSDRVNVNPFSDVVTRSVYQQAGGAGAPDASGIPAGECAAVQEQIREIISPVLALYGIDEDAELIGMEDFSANGFGLDGIFDDFNMEITDEGNFVLSSKVDNAPIVSIAVSEISEPSENVEQADMTEVITLRMLDHIKSVISFENFGGDNTSSSEVSKNLSIFTETYNKVLASWTSSNSTVVSTDGQVNVPAAGADSVDFTLTLSKNGYSVTKVFKLTVVDCSVDANAVTAGILNLTFDSISGSNSAENDVRTDLVLSASGSCGTTVSWSSAAEDVVAVDGEVFRHITEDKSATISASVAKGSAEETKSFSLTIPVVAVTSINYMAYFVQALDEDGILWTWGDNRHGNLGDGTTTDSAEPKLLPSPFYEMSNLKSISATSEHTLALKNDGTLWAWGENTYGELGINSTDDSLSPAQVGEDTDWEKIYATNYVSFGIKTDGTLWSWGRNDYGQLGLGDFNNYHTPQKVNDDTDWDYIIGVLEHFIGVKTDGSLFIWGWNQNGQIGNGQIGDDNNVNSPIAIGSISDWKSLALGYRHTIGVKSDGSLWAWGENTYGSYGDGTYVSVTTEKRIGTDNDWSKVYAGERYTFAIKDNGNIYSTGSNSSGRLGIGSSDAKFNTFQLFGTTAEWQKLYFGFDSGFGIKADGTVWAWGDNTSGHLGDGTTDDRLSPIQVFPTP